MAGREALVVATGSYTDARLRQLRSPSQDADAIARVLADPGIGDYDVTKVVDATESKLRRELHRFFAKRSRDDLLLVHMSCHGIKDDEGRLYFAATDTSADELTVTAVSSSFLSEEMERCRARSIVLLLDCCYAGAFAAGAKGDAGVHLKEKLAGNGRAVLTASNEIEYSWSDDGLSGAPQPSVFTAAVVEGLETGAADRDGDGRVSIHDLHEHVTERMLEADRKQTPLKWEMGVEGTLCIARVPPRPATSAAVRTTSPSRTRPAPGPVPPPPAPRPLRPTGQQAVRQRLQAVGEALDSRRREVALPALRGGRLRKPSRWPAVAGVLLVAALVAVGLLQVLPRDGGSVVEVSGLRAFTDTGIDVEAGDTLAIEASGQLCDDASRPDQCFDPEGIPDVDGTHPGDPHEANHAALVGRVGDGVVFEIGGGGRFQVAGPGRLLLGVNDDPLDDNRGGYRAVVTVE